MKTPKDIASMKDILEGIVRRIDPSDPEAKGKFVALEAMKDILDWVMDKHDRLGVEILHDIFSSDESWELFEN